MKRVFVDYASLMKLTFKKKILFSLLAVLVSIFFVVVVIEVYYRLQDDRLSFDTIDDRPIVMHPERGLSFAPGKNTRKANGIDYDVTQKANKHGFLDRNHELKKADDTYRILIIGDSFVEAAQVPIEKKIQVLLDRKLKGKLLGLKVESIAMAFSGMGTANQLVYYRTLGKDFNPDLVVLVFISNDFANNSPILHSLAEGWFPYSGPRFFYEINFANDSKKFIPFPINFNYLSNVRNVTMPLDVPMRLPLETWKMDSFFSWSKAYRDVSTDLKEKNRKKNQQVENFDVIAQRLQYLKNHKIYDHKALEASIKDKFKDWDYPNDVSPQTGFFLKSTSMPKIFREALQLTELSLVVFNQEVTNNKSKFLVMSGAYLSSEKPQKTWGREVDDGGLIGKLKGITTKFQIPLLDLYPEFEKRGGVEKTKWKKDSHWNEKGHEWAADALSQYILKNKIIK